MKHINQHLTLFFIWLVPFFLSCQSVLGSETDFDQLPREIRLKILLEEYEDPQRAEWQKVDEIIRVIGLKEGDRIADIGGGSGYFSRPFAHHIGASGVVYCCDFNDVLLEHLQEKTKEEELYNIVTVYAARNRPMLPPDSADIIFFCNVHHYLDDPVQYYKDLKPLLRSGGKAVIVIWKKILNKEQKERPLYDETVNSMKSAGWRLVWEEKELLEKQYLFIFKPESNLK